VGRTTVQRRWLFTAEAGIQCRTSLFVIYDGQSDTVTRFQFRCASVSPC
jgi:hypothetical protein